MLKIYNKRNDERSKKKVSFSCLVSYYTRVFKASRNRVFFKGSMYAFFEEDGPKYRNMSKIYKSKLVL